jgi:phosphotransacetylase
MGYFSAKFIEQAASITPKARIAVVYPCSAFALKGAIELKSRNLGEPILLGPLLIIQQVAKQLGVDLTGFTIVDLPNAQAAADKAVELAKAGSLDLIMKGSIHTSDLMRSILNSTQGLKTDKRASHCCVMDIPECNHPLLVADIAVNVSPDLEAKKQITQNAINLALAIGIKQVKVAILSADEQVRVQIPSTLDAACLAKMAERGQITDAIVDGPLALDEAVSVLASEVKGIKSPIAGNADVLIVPNIEAGNILVKQLKYFSNALMPGIVMGTKIPVIITSRADEPLTRIASCAIGILYLHWCRMQLENSEEA